ncbi:small ribosomal subunit protein eS27-like [Saccopteryx leptura]|uniref:small ribosomal subunit protein eS27-like n=1 Tax=Saccopteryx leptura TaxID=249018 RepID=UPI00339C309B
MTVSEDLFHPSAGEETQKKCLMQSPNSYFMDVKRYEISTIVSHAQTGVLCVGCFTVLCQPVGGKARLTEGCSLSSTKRILNQDEWGSIPINTF